MSDAATESPGAPSAAWKLWGTILAAGFLPGALAGAELAGLLFFLNTDLPFARAPYYLALGLYGGLLGAGSLLLHLPWTWNRPRRARRLLPWTLTAAIAAAAVLAWSHAALLSYYLPPGLNIRLIKAAVSLTAATLAGFYTALLHSVHDREYGPRSRAFVAVVALVSIAVMVERREAFKVAPASEPLPFSLAARQQRPRLCVIGLDAATLDVLLPLAEQGRLPFFASLLESGASGRLASFRPVRDVPLWTTLATGKLPYKHGLLDRVYFPVPFLGRDSLLTLWPRGIRFSAWGLGGTDPVRTDATLLRALPLWDILGRLGMPSGLVGWPGSDPVSPELTFAFSDRFFQGEAGPHTAGPPELAERGELFRVAPDHLDPALVAGLGEAPPASVLQALTDDLWRESLTLFLLEQRQEVGVLFLRLPGLAEVSRQSFGAYAAVHLQGEPSSRYGAAAEFVPAYYEHLDAALARIWGREHGPRLLAVVSPYGVESATGLKKLWSEVRRGRAARGFTGGAPDGILLLAGTGIRPGAHLAGAELVDVVPTLLYGLGLPVARDLDGRVLTGAFETAFLASHPLTFLPSYETLEPPEWPPPALAPRGLAGAEADGPPAD